jgi:hypothetical protein
MIQVEVENDNQVFLSRRNLQTLLNKLDRRARGEETTCTIVPGSRTEFPQPPRLVTAVEDDVYYAEHAPGIVHPSDDPAKN